MSQVQISSGYEAFNGWRTESMYSFSEAAHLANVSTTTVKNWLFGYTVRDREVPPLFSSENGAMVSFLQMIEDHGRWSVSQKRIRDKECPFQNSAGRICESPETLEPRVPAHLKLEAIGGHIVHILKGGDSTDSFQAVDVPEQWTLPGLLRETIDQIDYDQDLAVRWFPIGRSVPIVVDPRLSAGLPVIQGRGGDGAGNPQSIQSRPSH